MNRQQRRSQNKSKKQESSFMPHLTLSPNSQFVSMEELPNLENISMESLENMPQELKDLMSQMESQEPKQKRQYKKRTSNQTSDISGLEGSDNKEDVAPKRPKMTAKQKKVNDGLLNLLGTVGTGLCTAGTVSKKQLLILDGYAVLNAAPPIADSLIEVGKQFPNVMTTLEKITEGSAIVGLIAAVGGLATTISINHGWIKQDALSGFFNASQVEMATGTTLND